MEQNPRKINNKNTIITLIATGLFGLVVFFVYPQFYSALFAIIRVFFLIVILIFVLVTILVLIGFRRQAKQLLLGLVDGSLSLIDLTQQLKVFYIHFSEFISKLFLKLIPLYAFLLNVIIYLVLMYVYKSVGAEYDVTWLTIILSTILVLLVAFINKPKASKEVVLDTPKVSFMKNFNDFLEIMIFVFFLTMDSTNLFFLPDNLNTELHAAIGSYDLMLKGIDFSTGIATTLNIIIFTLIVEIIRNTIGIIVTARKHYDQLEADNYSGEEPLLRVALSKSIRSNIDDLLRFVTFITFMILVFLLFPRLKLLAMLCASIAGLLADLLIPLRLKTEKKEDLIGKIFSRFFRI